MSTMKVLTKYKISLRQLQSGDTRRLPCRFHETFSLSNMATRTLRKQEFSDPGINGDS